ncbi:MAG TPA: four helix bundle protein [Chloroflexota bacterium]|jgi:four helix bundle protein
MASGQGVKDLESLGIWRRAYELALQVYEETALLPGDADTELRAQLRRAAGAVGGHIADGFGRYSRTEYLRALHQARGALMETRHYLHLARALDYLDGDAAERLVDATTRLNGQLHRTVMALRDRAASAPPSEPGRRASAVDN